MPEAARLTRARTHSYGHGGRGRRPSRPAAVAVTLLCLRHVPDVRVGGSGRTVTAMSEFRVVVCGGGIAAVEGLLRLRRLLGSSVDIDVVAPNDELVMRPLAVRQPFAFGPPSRYELGRILADNDANWLKDTLAWVDREAQVVHTDGGESLRYDALLIAVGGRQIEAFEHVTHVPRRGSRRDLSGCRPGRRGGLLEEHRFSASRWAGVAAPAL